VDKPDMHLHPQTNTHTDPTVRSSKSSLCGESVAEDANTNMREVSSATSETDEDHSQATTAVNSVLARLDSESEQGDQSHKSGIGTLQCAKITMTRN